MKADAGITTTSIYNRAVTNVNVTVIHNVYETRVTEVNNRVSYNGGNGGIEARASAEQERAASERHIPPVAAQTQHVAAARSNPELRASTNQGRPPIAATQRPNEFKGNGVVAAKEAGAPYKAPERAANNGAARTENNNTARTETNRTATPAAAPKPTHAKEVQPPARTAPNTGNPATDKKYQAEQDKLYKQQDQQHQKLAAQQEQDHQRATQQKANDARNQQLEQKHQQQTDAMEQKHTQQQQKLQQKYTPAPQQHSAPQSHGSEKPK